MRADADIEGHSEFICQLRIEVSQRLEHSQSGSNGVETALLGRISTNTKQSNDLVADILINDTVIHQDRIADGLEEAIENVHNIVGKVLVHEWRELANVAEQDRQRSFPPTARSKLPSTCTRDTSPQLLIASSTVTSPLTRV